jgi:hypothetical protein
VSELASQLDEAQIFGADPGLMKYLTATVEDVTGSSGEVLRRYTYKKFPVLVELRCGEIENGKPCGRSTGARVLATPKGPIIFGKDVGGFVEENKGWPEGTQGLAGTIQRHRQDAKEFGQPSSRWTPAGHTWAQLVGFFEKWPNGWGPTTCSRNHWTIITVAALLSATKNATTNPTTRRRRPLLTSPVVDYDERPPRVAQR